MQATMSQGVLERQLPLLVEGLGRHHGYRSVWLAPSGELWHAEPDDEALEALGHRYLGTFVHPTVDDLQACLAGVAVPETPCLDLRSPGPRGSVERRLDVSVAGCFATG